ncbi:MAG: photosystem II reaction center protein PsbN [Brasilonema octagenarum HA4186-MV1]|jgi:PsbN protein|uniref:Protein PsbN n=2 Tax=Brasilonema TaxID=383614 RepID=A0A856MMM4_9CYAN|nr:MULTISPECIES: photosystem II reaction center protein PsbN [Brasilonema]MBW4595921.1 photosystem II reaction center protein PsbN [Brasilonema angustatum HA4187-MV1]MBW4625723.1 photosystem II reaction center protein PsbN [Brasilonema octagenarum HA4186-MV1]QDL17695.1 photosystem II reaction center protein PsbN [Brasilonema octagenarum UFV-E1]NMF61718.1 photosystem II reaction center protein PsbN [Brasilonema octagenarum UFV-OR1]QDL11354.1 photosystem II reaction center protein PsbN [Brasilon
MEPAIVLSISVGAVVIFITAFSIYTSFGPPGKELSDPFEDHED